MLIRSLIHHFRSHLAVTLGVAVTTAVLVGSLLMGDVVQGSLRRIAQARLGRIDLAIVSDGRYYQQELAIRLGQALPGAVVAPVLQLPGSASNSDKELRTNQVAILGIDDHFALLAPTPWPTGISNGAVLNQHLAARLGLEVGQDVVLRFEKPSFLPRDAPMSSDKAKDTLVAWRLPVQAIISDAQLGRFGLAANQTAPFNVFVPLAGLQKHVGEAGSVNQFLIGGQADPDLVQQRLAEVWRLADVGVSLQPVSGDGLEMRSKRIFLDAREVSRIGTHAHPTFTYLVNELAIGDRRVHYAMVSAVPPDLFPAAGGPPVPTSWNDDGIVLNERTALDLQARIGDRLDLKYYVMGNKRELSEMPASFTVVGIVPMTGLAADRSLMPAFPGISDKASCRDWDAGVAINFQKVRKDVEERYWDEHRGTPRAFLTLTAGRRLWTNRFGATTALRWYGKPDLQTVAQQLNRNLAATDYGLSVRPVRRQALTAVDQAMDFGSLFISLSSFLIAAALLLTALLFAFGLQHRRRELGVLLAVGFRRGAAARRLLGEALVVAIVGIVIGLPAAVGFTRGILAALTGLWPAAVGGIDLTMTITPASLGLGALIVLLVALAVFAGALRTAGREPVTDLLRGELPGGQPSPHVDRRWLLTGLILILAGLVVALVGRPHPAAVLRFFGAGSLLLLGGLSVTVWLLGRLATPRREVPRGLLALALSASGRRRGRGLTVVAVLACSAFLVLSIGAFHQDGSINAERRDSGTGGFTFFGQASVPLNQDLDQPAARKTYNLTSLPGGVSVVPLRSNRGDEATCLNLNRATLPRLWGVDPAALAQRQAFRFTATAAHPKPLGNPWLLLAQPRTDGLVPAVVDANTALWAMGNAMMGQGKTVGDIIPYPDEFGQTFRIIIVGLLEDSMLQGAMLIPETAFIEHFPSDGGYDIFLVDAPPAEAANAERQFESRLAQYGLELEPAAQRYNALKEMQNVYLVIFQILGALGMLLGSIGLAVILLRNTVERRHELALLRALGFPRHRVGRMLILEHAVLLLLGLTIGLAAAAVAILPSILSPGRTADFRTVTILLALVFLVGLGSILLAGRWAMGGKVAAGLRNA